MAKRKRFEKLDLLLPKDGARVRVSEFHRKYLASQPNFWETMEKVQTGSIDMDRAILTLTGVDKRDDLIAYGAFRDVFENFLGSQKRKDDMESVSLYALSDSSRIFNSEKKIDAFMAYFLKHLVERRVNELRPATIIEGSLCVDYYYFLQILEDYLVEKCFADREIAGQYLVKYFTTYYGMFFMVFANFKLENMLVSMRIPDMVYMKNAKGSRGVMQKRECLHAWIPALYSDNFGNELYFRQIQFSLGLIKKMALENEKSFDDFRFDMVLFDRLISHFERDELTQLYWAKDAVEALREDKKSDGISYQNFFLYRGK